VGSAYLSNGKKKGEGNGRTATAIWRGLSSRRPTLRCATVSRRARFYQRKKAQRNSIVAVKAVAHKLARACYHMLKLQQPFCVKRCFA
jgi:hypothetical protein